jgi:alkaline phosphatase D
MPDRTPLGRRAFVRGALAAGAARAGLAGRARSARGHAGGRAGPAIPFGVQAGGITADRAVAWSATDRPARLVVEWPSWPRGTRCPLQRRAQEG